VQAPCFRGRKALPRRVEGVDELLADAHLAEPPVQLLDVDPVALVILRRDPEGVRLDPQVRVLGDHDHGNVPFPRARGEGDTEDLVVPGPAFQFRRKQGRPLASERHAQDPSVLQRDSLPEVAGGAQAVDVLGHRPGVAPEHVQVFFEMIELLDHRDRDDHPVVFEMEQRVGVVQQDVRVEHEVFDHGVGTPIGSP